MTLEPKPLEPGWLLRTLKASLRLPPRAPGWWFALYVGLPVLTFYTPWTAPRCFGLGWIIICGTYLCFIADRPRDYQFEHVVHILLSRPQPIALLVVASVFIAWVAPTTSFLAATPIEAYLSFGLNYAFLIPALLFSSGILLVLFDLPRAMILSWIHRDGSDEQRRKIAEEISLVGTFSLFALHLLGDTVLTWSEACELSRKGVLTLGIRPLLLVMAMPVVVILCPLAQGVVIPWVYVIYRELFWQQGIQDREEVGLLAPVRAKG